MLELWKKEKQIKLAKGQSHFVWSLETVFDLKVLSLLHHNLKRESSFGDYL